jgi:hypothetical protein
MSVAELRAAIEAAIEAAIVGAQGIDARYVVEALQTALSHLDSHVERLAEGD